MNKAYYYPLSAGSVHQVRPDLMGTVMAGDDVTLVRWEIPANRLPTPLHAHQHHEQFTTVISGMIETTVGDQVLTMHPGDTCHVPKGMAHGGTRALGDSMAVLVDVFSPPRLDYVAAAKGA